MKKISEVIEMGRVDLTQVENLKGRVFVQGYPTDCMQLRVLTKPYHHELMPQLDHKDFDNDFVCGVDMSIMKGGAWLAMTTLGFWGYSFMRMIELICRYYDDSELKNAYALYLCDDSQNLSEDDFRSVQPQYLGCGEPVDRIMKDIDKIEF